MKTSDTMIVIDGGKNNIASPIRFIYEVLPTFVHKDYPDVLYFYQGRKPNSRIIDMCRRINVQTKFHAVPIVDKITSVPALLTYDFRMLDIPRIGASFETVEKYLKCSRVNRNLNCSSQKQGQ
jgi:hypothetical protein